METVQYSLADKVATITIMRAKQLNALNSQVLADLSAALDQAVADSASAVVLRGEGDKSFVAGADIKQMSDLSPEQAAQFCKLGQDLTRKIETHPAVTIAAVQGFALGGGCELAMACDMVIASEKALFGQPEVDLGLVAGFGGTQRLAQRVGLPVAMAMLCAGRKLKGPEAFTLGLVSEVVAPDQLDEAVAKSTAAIVAAGPKAVAASKILVRARHDALLQEGLDQEREAFAACFANGEGAVGMQAFIDRTKPSF